MKNYPHLQVDLANCDKEPIHIIGRIQAHGYLLIFDPHTLRIEQISANISELCSLPIEKVLASTLSDLLPAQVSRAIVGKVARQETKPFTIRLAEKTYVCSFSLPRGKVLLEIEPFEKEHPEYLQKLQSFLWSTLR